MDEPSIERSPRWRKELGAVLCLATGAAFVPSVGTAPVLFFAIAAAMLAAVAARQEGLGPQIFTRGVLWSNLLLSLILTVGAGRSDAALGLLLAPTAGGALLVLGRVGLDARSDAFAPKAFRGPLLLALVMALADALSLLLFAFVTITKSHGVGFFPLAGCAAVMLIAIAGLYRLRTWAVVLNIIGNIGVAALALAGALELFEPVVYALCTTAVIQLIIPIPMVLAMIRGRAPERIDPHPAWGYLFPAIISTVMLVSLSTPWWRSHSCF